MLNERTEGTEDEIIEPTDAEAAELMARHPLARTLTSRVDDGPTVTILANPMAGGTYNRVQTLAENQRHLAATIIMRDCLVWPDERRWKDIIERYPGLPDSFAIRLLRLAGGMREAEVKK